MNKKIVEMLHLSLEPVGIFLGNTSAVCELEASPQRRNCVIPFVWLQPKERSHLWMRMDALVPVEQLVLASVMDSPA